MIAYQPTQYSRIFANTLKMLPDKFEIAYIVHLLGPCSLLWNHHPVTNVVALNNAACSSDTYIVFSAQEGRKNCC